MPLHRLGDQRTTCEDEKQMRQQVNGDLQSLATTPKNFSRVKVIPMFHGTKEDLLPNIFCGNLAALSTTDKGFFGQGVYHSSFASYAYKYAKMDPLRKGALLMNWICFSSPYPVIHHPEVRDDQHWEELQGSDLKEKHWKHLHGLAGSIQR